MAQETVTPLQRSTLETVYIFLIAVTPFLDAIANAGDTLEERMDASNLRDLAVCAQHKVIAEFPEMLEWLRAWEEAGGGR